MTILISQPFSLRILDLTGLAHGAWSAKSTFAAFADGCSATGASVFLPTAFRHGLAAMFDSVTAIAQRYSIAGYIGKVGAKFPRLNMMGMKFVRSTAMLTGEVISRQNAIAPCTVLCAPMTITRRFIFILSCCQILTLLAAILVRMPALLLEWLLAKFAGQHRRGVVFVRTLLRACQPIIVVSDKGRTAHDAIKRPALVTGLLARATNLEWLPALLANPDDIVFSGDFINGAPVDVIAAGSVDARDGFSATGIRARLMFMRHKCISYTAYYSAKRHSMQMLERLAALGLHPQRERA